MSEHLGRRCGRVGMLIGVVTCGLVWAGSAVAQDARGLAALEARGGGLASSSAGLAVVEGKVTAAEGGSALSGVQVELVELARRTWTDDLGRFRFVRVPAGSHTLRFHVIGRAVLERTVVVEGSGVETRGVSLGEMPVPLDPVLVLMDRTRLAEGAGAERVPGSVQVVGARALIERPVVFDDVHAYLREVPGVNVQEEEGYGRRPHIGLRGTGSERSSKVTVMEDGVLIAPAPYAAPAAYYFPVAGRMEAIEVRKGSSQIRYGPSTIGGALNLVSSAIPGTFSVLADGAAGPDAARKLRVRAGDTGRHLGWMVETYRLETAGFKRLDTGGRTGFDLVDYVGKVRVNTDRGRVAAVYQELELKLGWTEERADETYVGLTESDFRATPYRRYAGSQADVLATDHRQVQLRHFLRLPAGVDLTTTAYRNTFARNWYKLDRVGGVPVATVLTDPERYAAELSILGGADSPDGALLVRANRRDYVSRGIQSALGASFGTDMVHDVELGLRYHEDLEDRFQHEDAYAMRGGIMVVTAAGAPGSQANRVSDARAWSFHAQDRIRLGGLTVTPGLRYETIRFAVRGYAPADATRAEPVAVRENAVSSWVPGIGANLALHPGVNLFAGVHWGFGPPGPGADQETRPESSVNYEFGARLGVAGVLVHVAGFYSDYTNILGAATLASGTDGSGDLYNGGAVRVAGLELMTSHDPLATRLSEWSLPFQLGYTFTRAAFETSFRSDFAPWGAVEAGDALPYIPPHQLFARTGVERGSWSAELTATAASAARTVAGRGELGPGEGTDAFLVLGLGARYAVGERATLYGAVQNVTDATYVAARRPAGARPGLPRTFQLGLRLHR